MVLLISWLPAPVWPDAERGGSRPTEGRIALGGGAAYFAEDFRGGLGEILHNTWGFYLQGEYAFSNYFSLQALFQSYPDFAHQRSSTWPPGGQPVKEKITYSGFDLSLNVKGCLPWKKVRPYGVAGLGYGYGTYKARVSEDYVDPRSNLYASYPETKTGTGPITRLGAGCDFFWRECFGLNAAIAYNLGWGEIDRARFVSFTLGASYVF